MNNNVYIKQTNVFEYNNDFAFNPSKKYPEGLNIDIKSDERIYDIIRDLFVEMNLDKENIGKKSWNPFKDFIKEGNNVVIKPNLVNHFNPCKNGNTDSLITNFAIIRPIIDYVLIALNNTGKVIIGDAPVQECNFDEVKKLYNLEEGINCYNAKGYSVELKDFRKNNNSEVECTIIDLKKDSEFVETDNLSYKYAITNYNLKYMHEHHSNEKHEYLISNDILMADVIINLPKPKCHRKAGMTACLKNFIGANAKKEFIPHHRTGSIKSGGDEYPENSFIKLLLSTVSNYSYTRNIFIRFLIKIMNYILRILKKSRYLEGSWYGNDTIWRSILDINKIVMYSDKKGKMKTKPQRVILNIADMIISGEKEGPLMPSNKNVGIVVASFNAINMDSTIASIMGFDSQKIKYIKNGYKLKKYKLANSTKYINYSFGKRVNVGNYNKHFIATDGWSDYLNGK